MIVFQFNCEYHEPRVLKYQFNVDTLLLIYVLERKDCTLLIKEENV